MTDCLTRGLRNAFVPAGFTLAHEDPTAGAVSPIVDEEHP